MKLFCGSTKYIFSNFWRILLLIAAPALGLSFIFSPSGTISFLSTFSQHDKTSFANIYLQVSGINQYLFWIGFIGIAVAAVAIAVMFGAIDRSMRIGDFSLSISRAKVRLDYNILTAVKLVITFIIAYEFFIIINCAFIFLWSTVCITNAGAVLASSITYGILLILLLLVFSTLILWPTAMLHMGVKTGQALKIAVLQMRGHLKDVFFTLLLPIIPFIVLAIVNVKTVDNVFFRVAVDSVLLGVLMVYYIVTMYILFYDSTGMDRADLKRNVLWSKRFRGEK